MAERIRKVQNEPCGVPLISIHLDKYYYVDRGAGCKHELGPLGPTISERNQEVTLYLQELTSALPIQRLFLVHLMGPQTMLRGGNTSHDCQGFQ